MPPSADDFVLTAVHVRGEGWTVTVADPRLDHLAQSLPRVHAETLRGASAAMRMEIARALRMDPAKVSVFVMTQRDEQQQP